jgi:hypothetical protein
MPFASEFKDVYEDAIAKAANSLSLTAIRADDVFSGSRIMQDVWHGICQAGIVVADCTTRNPNVFYEIGLAHAFGKPVALISQTADDIPVDLRHYKYLLYELGTDGLEALGRDLCRVLDAELGLSEHSSRQHRSAAPEPSRVAPAASASPPLLGAWHDNRLAYRSRILVRRSIRKPSSAADEQI